jgi:hypothetical protein
VHNPSILNPDFLRVQNIVPEEWGWRVAETLTTPPFSLVKYDNGVSITVEPNKIQVADTNPESPPPEKSSAAVIAESYVAALPHVHYTAVGINFLSFIETREPEKRIKERFLKAGKWDNEEHPLHAASVRLVYAFRDGCRVTLSVDPGEVTLKDDSGGRPAILANGNFHRQCEGHPGSDEVKRHLGKLPSDWDMYQLLLRDAIGSDGE